MVGVGEPLSDEVDQGRRRQGDRLIVIGANVEVRAAVVVSEKLECKGGGSRRASVLESELEAFAFSNEVRAGVRPGMQVCTATQSLTKLGSGALANMVDYRDGSSVLALEASESTKQGGDVGRAVFVEMMETDERVKQDKLGFEMLNGGVETSQVVWGIET